ncbi:unnamed protein product [Lota lota]
MDPPFEAEESVVDVQRVQAQARLCCRNRRECKLCLAVELHIHIHPQLDTSDGDEGGGRGGRPTNEGQLVCGTYGSTALLSVHPSRSAHPFLELSMPSLDEVPRINTVLDPEKGRLELQVGGSSTGRLPVVWLPVVCLQYETDGACRALIQRNEWRNLSVSLALVERSRALLLWNLSGPCRLEAQVWPCRRGEAVPRHGCKEITGMRKTLSPDAWRQTNEGRWGQGLGVSVDQWSRSELGSLGPLPWLYAQLLRLEQQGGGKVVLVLTRGALQKAQEWTCLSGRAPQGPPPTKSSSPHSDVFSASLACVAGDRQLGQAGERFLLVDFEACPVELACSDRRVPELLEGLSLFRLPSQSQAMLRELTRGRPTAKDRGAAGCVKAGVKTPPGPEAVPLTHQSVAP